MSSPSVVNVEIENESSFLLSPKFSKHALPGWTKKKLKQAYVFVNGEKKFRVRQEKGTGSNKDYRLYEKTVKTDMRRNGEVLEKNTPITKSAFKAIWKESSVRLEKVRYSKTFGDEKCDLDFFKNPHTKEIYFVKAEIEMPTGREKPKHIPPEIADSILYDVPKGDRTFSSRKLADPNYASEKLKEVKQPRHRMPKAA